MEPQHIGRPDWHERCLTLLRGTSDAVFICGRDGRIALVNPAFWTLAGKPENPLVGLWAADLAPSPLSEMLLMQNEKVLADGQPRTFEMTLPAAAGPRFFEVRKALSEDWVPGVLGIAHEITGQREVERTIIDTSDHEKERLGHELRENFCQHLVGISLMGNVLFEELSRAGLEQARFAREIARMVKEVVSEIRALEKGLSVAHLEQGEGLVEALRDLVELTRLQHRLECELRAPARKLKVPPATAMYLFRIAQEAVDGALRRRLGGRLSIRVKAGRRALELSIRDAGARIPRKLDLEAWSRQQFPIMRYRSRVIGARLEFKRPRAGGIEIICRVPVGK